MSFSLKANLDKSSNEIQKEARRGWAAEDEVLQSFNPFHMKTEA